MDNLASVIRQWALDDGAEAPDITFEDERNRVQYEFGAGIDGERLPAYFDADEEREWLGLTIHAPGVVPEERRAPVAELLTWVNASSLDVGNFEISATKGQVRFRAGLNVPASQVFPSMLTSLVATGAGAMSRFLPAIRAVGFAGMSPRAAEAMSRETGTSFSPTVIPADDALPWSSFHGTAVLEAWAGEVRMALEAGGGANAWKLAGRAIVVEHEYPGIGADLARRLAADCGLPLGIFREEDLVTLPDFSVLERTAPVMIFLGAGDWQKRGDKNELGEAAVEVQGKVADLLRNFNPAMPVVCVTIVQSIASMASALRRVGMFDRWLSLPSLPHGLAGEALLDLVGRECCAPSLIAATAKIGKLLSYCYGSPEQRTLMALGLRRRHARLGRSLEFRDLVELDAHDLAESDRSKENPEGSREYVACHEAGHAAMAYLDSGGKDVPEYSSILPHGATNGVVVDSVTYAFAREGRFTFDDLRHKIRISLAGRAAEEVCFGAGGISSGASLDLECCTRSASIAFAYWGFAPDMEREDGSATNLAVIIDRPSPSEEAHLEELVRRFLAKEYLFTRDTLAENRVLLNAISERLQTDSVLDQWELETICRGVERADARPAVSHS